MKVASSLTLYSFPVVQSNIIIVLFSCDLEGALFFDLVFPLLQKKKKKKKLFV